MKEIPIKCLQYYIRHFPVDKGKYALLRRLWEPFSFNRYHRETELRQAPVKMMCDLTRYIQRHIYFWGGYEERESEVWMKIAARSKVIFDVGANVGIYSLLAASINPGSEIHSFEPTAEVFKSLEGNIALNSIKNITPNEIALGRSDSAGSVHALRGSDKVANEGMNYVTAEATQASDRPITIRSIESYCHQHRIKHIDLMKMDIEGGEYDALLGAQHLLREKDIDYIFIELCEYVANRSGHSTADIKSLLLNFGYYLYEVSPRGLIPIKSEGIHRRDLNMIAFAENPEGKGIIQPLE